MKKWATVTGRGSLATSTGICCVNCYHEHWYFINTASCLSMSVEVTFCVNCFVLSWTAGDVLMCVFNVASVHMSLLDVVSDRCCCVDFISLFYMYKVSPTHVVTYCMHTNSNILGVNCTYRAVLGSVKCFDCVTSGSWIWTLHSHGPY